MATDALQVVSLAAAKRALDIPDSTTDRDDRVTDVIRQAVDYVSALVGIPLVDDTRRFDLLVCSSLVALIRQPPGWPRPKSVDVLNYRQVEDGPTTVTPATDPQAIEFDQGRQAWIVQPIAFNRPSWSTALIDPSVSVTVGLDEQDDGSGIPHRHVSAVTAAIQALYANEPMPQHIGWIINGR